MRVDRHDDAVEAALSAARARGLYLIVRFQDLRERRLVVIDGTWHHARTLYRDIPVLRSLPHLTLPGHLRSAFQIRRQPSQHCLSTIEAIVHALFALWLLRREADRKGLLTA